MHPGAAPPETREAPPRPASWCFHHRCELDPGELIQPAVVLPQIFDRSVMWYVIFVAVFQPDCADTLMGPMSTPAL
jgi:hypothetical protein